AAMGGEPLGAVIGLGLPKRARLSEVEALYRGLARAARRFSCPIVGGDTNRSKGNWTIAVTLLGETRRRPLLRSAARPGDSLWVTGELGGAALAWRAQRAGKTVPEAIRRRLHSPTPRLQWGRHLSAFGKVGAAIDLSDGLAGDLGHIAEASGVGFDVEWETLPRPRSFAGLCAKVGTEVWETLLEGGEDYELLFTLQAGAEQAFGDYALRRGLKAARIGRARRGTGIRWLEQGRELRRRFGGFRHF
ncbi:MAG: thiamine-phosphate kinase, partial [Deltaproteobacteria bacterium]|nr:thiamine-phosphate kinase [Deltaproteobacteria bacterium]